MADNTVCCPREVGSFTRSGTPGSVFTAPNFPLEPDRIAMNPVGDYLYGVLEEDLGGNDSVIYRWPWPDLDPPEFQYSIIQDDGWSSGLCVDNTHAWWLTGSYLHMVQRWPLDGGAQETVAVLPLGAEEDDLFWKIVTTGDSVWVPYSTYDVPDVVRSGIYQINSSSGNVTNHILAEGPDSPGIMGAGENMVPIIDPFAAVVADDNAIWGYVFNQQTGYDEFGLFRFDTQTLTFSTIDDIDWIVAPGMNGGVYGWDFYDDERILAYPDGSMYLDGCPDNDDTGWGSFWNADHTIQGFLASEIFGEQFRIMVSPPTAVG